MSHKTDNPRGERRQPCIQWQYDRDERLRSFVRQKKSVDEITEIFGDCSRAAVVHRLRRIRLKAADMRKEPKGESPRPPRRDRRSQRDRIRSMFADGMSAQEIEQRLCSDAVPQAKPGIREKVRCVEEELRGRNQKAAAIRITGYTSLGDPIFDAGNGHAFIGEYALEMILGDEMGKAG